jgi:DNA modification methylase
MAKTKMPPLVLTGVNCKNEHAHIYALYNHAWTSLNHERPQKVVLMHDTLTLNKIYQGDALSVLKTFPDEIIDTVICSPPYWNLRDYGTAGQLGLEQTFEEYIDKLIQIFAEVKRVLKPTGTCWVNISDSYAGAGGMGSFVDNKAKRGMSVIKQYNRQNVKGIPSKSLCGIPERFALSMTDRLGFIRRNTLIWKKNNVMPSSAQDRYTIDFEYIYFFSKSQKYYFEQQLEPVKLCSIERLNRAVSNKHKWINGADGQTKHTMNQPRPNRNTKIPAEICEMMGSPMARYKRIEKSNAPHEFEGPDNMVSPFDPERGRNPRAVWEINIKPFSEAHFAVFPPELPRRCIMAGCPKDICKKCGKARERVYKVEKVKCPPIGGVKKSGGDNPVYSGKTEHNRITGFKYTDCGCNAGWDKGIVLDPFMGSGTTAIVALKLNRNFVGIELNKEYIRMANARLKPELEKQSLF